MSITYTYTEAVGATDTFSVELSDAVRLGDLGPLTEMAEHLASGSGTITFDDPDADLGNSDAILGNQLLEITEDECPSGNQRLYTGIFGVREYGRREGSSLVTGAAREIVAEMHDLNALASMRVIPNSNAGAIRPEETVATRMTWLMGISEMLTIADNGLIASSAVLMSPANYQGQRVANIINDCELAAGFGWNAFVYWDEAAAEPSLFFDNANTSTAYSSTLRISNDPDDVDDFADPAAVTFAPSMDARLRRDPTEIASGAYIPFKNNAAYRLRNATVDTYGRKDVIAPNANVSKWAQAAAQGDDLLYQHHTEDDRITVTVDLPPTHVNLIRAGHRIQVKFTHLPGYESWRWCRVVSRSPGQLRATDDRYQMRLDLSPQEESGTPYLIQVKTANSAEDEHVTLDDPVTVGSVIVALLLAPQGTQTTPEMNNEYGDWTQLGSYPVAYEGATPFIYASAWARIATSSDQSYGREVSGPTKIWLTVWEIGGATVDDVTVLSQQRQADSPLSIGTFTEAGFAVMSAGMTRGNDQTTGPTITTTPGTGWTERLDSVMVGNTWAYCADAAVPDGGLAATATATVTGGPGQSIGEWCGFAILFTRP